MKIGVLVNAGAGNRDPKLRELNRAIERVTGKDITDAMREHFGVFAPLTRFLYYDLEDAVHMEKLVRYEQDEIVKVWTPLLTCDVAVFEVPWVAFIYLLTRGNYCLANSYVHSSTDLVLVYLRN